MEFAAVGVQPVIVLLSTTEVLEVRAVERRPQVE